MPVFIALKPHRDIASGRVLRPNDEITSEEDLMKIFPGKFKRIEKATSKPVEAKHEPEPSVATTPPATEFAPQAVEPKAPAKHASKP